jgi:periplasmic divalent cation tolerance protein
MSEVWLVLTTLPGRAEAEAMANRLVEERLAACVQVRGPVYSTYRWEGKVEQAEEWQCQAKCLRALYPQVEAAIRGMHPYEVPEIVAVPVAAGYAAYLGWVEQESRPPHAGGGG